MNTLMNWRGRGFSTPPVLKLAPPQGLLIYRAWGDGSSEFGSGYFSLEKPSSVLDAELRFNIADWGNGVHFVSTFRMKPGVAYYVGPVAHRVGDIAKPGTQIFVEPLAQAKVTMVRSRELLRHDVTVVQRSGQA